MLDLAMSSSLIMSLLNWHLSVGADETIGTDPINRMKSQKKVVQVGNTFVPPECNTENRIINSSTSLKQNISININQTSSSYPLAKEASSFSELEAIVDNFEGCALKKTSTNLVFYNGSPQSRLMLIGEAPGAQEDLEGVPFVGPSGLLLDKMLASIDIQRSDVMVSNTVFWRPPGNRTPTLEETEACRPFLERLIELTDPRIIVALGGPAAKILLGETQGISKLRGKWFNYKNQSSVWATAIFHPAYLLRTPSQKRLAWQDLLAISARLISTK